MVQHKQTCHGSCCSTQTYTKANTSRAFVGLSNFTWRAPDLFVLIGGVMVAVGGCGIGVYMCNGDWGGRSRDGGCGVK